MDFFLQIFIDYASTCFMGFDKQGNSVASSAATWKWYDDDESFLLSLYIIRLKTYMFKNTETKKKIIFYYFFSRGC